MSGGKQVRIFLVDGTVGGLITAEIMNWTGQVTAAPRTDLGALMRLDEVARTGIYLLLGDDPEKPGRQLAYIGEADDVSSRLERHARDEKKDFWERVIVLTNKDANLTKAHARYLEARFIELATQADRVRLTNSTAPAVAGLPRADVSDMEYYIEQARIVLPVLNVNLLRVAEVTATPLAAEDPEVERSPLFTLTARKRGVSAVAQEVDGEFIVRAGSTVAPSWNGAGMSYRTLREQLEADGSLVSDSTGTRLVRDTIFASPSAASAVMLGRSSNGRTEWKQEGTGLAFGAWQDQQLDARRPDPARAADQATEQRTEHGGGA